MNWIKKEEEHPLGDVNKDGKITSSDLLLVKRHIVAGEKQEWILKDDKFKLADINNDGKVTVSDLLALKRLIVKQLGTN